MKFVCYKEYDDPAEPAFPGILYKGKTLPLARVVAVAEAFHPRSLAIPEDLNELIATLPAYAECLKELERAKVVDKIWPEIGVTIVSPLPRPNRIFAVGRNYAAHAAELGNEVPTEPFYFLKATTSVVGPDRPIAIPSEVGRVECEGELAVVIGKAGKHIAEADAYSHVAGYTLINDVTARDEQKRAQARGLPWSLSKGIDTFGPLGPCLITADEIKDPHTLDLSVSVNGEVKQRAGTGDMLFTIPRLIAAISRYVALEPGDVIATGTPPGVTPIKPGDTVEVRIPEIGTLSNPVIAANEYEDS